MKRIVRMIRTTAARWIDFRFWIVLLILVLSTAITAMDYYTHLKY